jgi:hypothetical protein
LSHSQTVSPFGNKHLLHGPCSASVSFLGFQERAAELPQEIPWKSTLAGTGHPVLKPVSVLLHEGFADARPCHHGRGDHAPPLVGHFDNVYVKLSDVK